MAVTQRFSIPALTLLLFLIFDHRTLQVSSALLSIPALNSIPELGVCGLDVGTLMSCNEAIKIKPPLPPTNQEPTPAASQSSSAVPLTNQSSVTGSLNQSSSAATAATAAAAAAPASSPTGSPAGSLSTVTASEQTTASVSFKSSELQSQCCKVVVDINMICICNLISLPAMSSLSLVNNFVHQVAELCNVGFTGCP